MAYPDRLGEAQVSGQCFWAPPAPLESMLGAEVRRMDLAAGPLSVGRQSSGRRLLVCLEATQRLWLPTTLVWAQPRREQLGRG
jgi:hypothetical protein